MVIGLGTSTSAYTRRDRLRAPQAAKLEAPALHLHLHSIQFR